MTVRVASSTAELRADHLRLVAAQGLGRYSVPLLDRLVEHGVDPVARTRYVDARMAGVEFRFSSEVNRWSGDSAWYFATVPWDVSELIREETDGGRGGFGSVKVAARIGETAFATSVFPDSKSQCFVLPVKKAVRKAEEIDDGDPVEIILRLVNLD